MNVSNIGQGLGDLILSIRRIKTALHFAWSDTRARYRRSVLGPFWMVLSTAISVAGLGFLWSSLLKQDPAVLVPSLTIGLVVWQLLASCVTEAPSVFVRNGHYIRNIPTPYFLFPLIMVIKNLINFFHNLIVVVLVFVWFSPQINIQMLLVIPGLLIVLGNVLWIILLLGIYGARFRDIEQVVSSMMPLLFFMSPVIYRPNQVSIGQHIVWLNPFSYMLTLIRDPVMGSKAPDFVYIVSIAVLIAGSIFTLYEFGRLKKSLAFWV